MIDSAIITGTGIYDIPGFTFEKMIIETKYGNASVNIGRKDGFEFAFLARHGLDHTTPPHKINYRANIKALKDLGVSKIIATNAVGSISRNIPPMGLAVLTDFLNFTTGRAFTFFDGGDSGLVHTNMDEPYCPSLRAKILELAPDFGLQIQPKATYVATNGPRFESPAEVRMYGQLGGDVVGMTGIPEVVLAKELQMHYAGICYSINWAAGLEQEMVFVSDKMSDIRHQLTLLLVRTLQEVEILGCDCERVNMVMHAPKK
jgi:5'-methylthioadenosine phosphorylase